MNNADFWASVKAIVYEGFLPEGLQKLDYYAELFIEGRIVYQRFSSLEQHGCAAGGATHVIASLLAGAEVSSNPNSQTFLDFKEESQCAARQASHIEAWAKAVGCWTELTDKSLPCALGEHIAEGGEAKVYDHGATLIKGSSDISSDTAVVQCIES